MMCFPQNLMEKQHVWWEYVQYSRNLLISLTRAWKVAVKGLVFYYPSLWPEKQNICTLECNPVESSSPVINTIHAKKKNKITVWERFWFNLMIISQAIVYGVVLSWFKAFIIFYS